MRHSALLWEKDGYNQFGLKPGQWTDDSSMALCIADTLLCCGDLDAIDLRQRFYLWNKYGYNNAFGRDPGREPRNSVGLGGNISESMNEWEREQKRLPATSAGDRFTSGNGSVMRNGAVPVWFRNDLEAGMKAAHQQSKTTHGGDEAAELCRLLTFVCTRFINGAERELLDDLSTFHTELYTVGSLAAARCEEPHADNANPIFGGHENLEQNRCWDWRSRKFRYCKERAAANPGYIGSYAMDAMSMALHCVYSTSTFEEACLKAANLRGDSDSVCAVVGQIAGALYGASAIPDSWLNELQRWDGGSIAARALMLHDHEVLGREAALSDAACATAATLGEAHK
jgi:ADP-ribosyl-[dinitrogen reductase] hydrolase